MPNRRVHGPGWRAEVALLLLGLGGVAAGGLPTQDLLQEEAQDYFQKWLQEDVLYIIAAEEKAVFEKLTTVEEKEQFIEQFWRRRDPDLSTAVNEYKEEHYRRIAYANEHFTAGVQGWRTDRGKIYIIHGPPDEIRSHAAGETYNRPLSEGGGTTNTYPFEVWRYRHLPGIGSDVELEFVDRSFSGYYQLVFSPWDKDLLLRIRGAGETLAEELGLARRQDHPFFNPGIQNREAYPFLWLREKDDPFRRYELFSQVQRPQEIRYRDLKEMVQVNVSYNNLPFKVRPDYFRLNEAEVLVPVTLEWQNQDLGFVEQQGNFQAKIAIYGIVTTITNQIITEFEDDVTVSYRPGQEYIRTLGRAMYQKVLRLPRGVPCKLDLVTKDLHGDKVGVVRQALRPPLFGEGLAASPLVLTNYVRLLNDEVPKPDQMFVLGDLWIRPSLDNQFTTGDELGIYLQLYNVAFDQSTLAPGLEIRYRILAEGRPLVELSDTAGDSIHFFSGQRVVLLKVLRLTQLKPGKYELEVEVRDRLQDASLVKKERFQVVPPVQLAAGR